MKGNEGFGGSILSYLIIITVICLKTQRHPETSDGEENIAPTTSDDTGHLYQIDSEPK